jgi:opacity protein-like surface antigen
MLKNFLAVATLAGLLSFASLGHSQALPTATGHGGAQAGIGWSWAKPDYWEKAIQGVTAFGDFDFTSHIGAEAEYHYLALETPNDLAENSFLVGPRFVLPRGKYSLYAKGLIGIGDIVIQEASEYTLQNPAGTYLTYAGGAGVDYRASRHIVVRGDFEYQHWSYRHGLTPTVFTVGAAYRFR